MAKTTKRRTVKRATKKTTVIVDIPWHGDNVVIPHNERSITSMSGPYLGMRIQPMQNATLRDNVEMQLTDRQLALLWTACVPTADAANGPDGSNADGRTGYNVKRHVVGTRREYNRGAHSQNGLVPDVPTPQFIARADGTIDTIPYAPPKPRAT